MITLANALDDFNDVDDDEVLRLYEHAKAIFSRVQGNLSPNVAVSDQNLASEYETRADRARDANDLDRCVTNLELALTHSREAERIYRTINFVDAAAIAAECVAEIEELLIEVKVARI